MRIYDDSYYVAWFGPLCQVRTKLTVTRDQMRKGQKDITPNRSLQDQYFTEYRLVCLNFISPYKLRWMISSLAHCNVKISYTKRFRILVNQSIPKNVATRLHFLLQISVSASQGSILHSLSYNTYCTPLKKKNSFNY